MACLVRHGRTADAAVVRRRARRSAAPLVGGDDRGRCRRRHRVEHLRAHARRRPVPAREASAADLLRHARRRRARDVPAIARQPSRRSGPRGVPPAGPGARIGRASATRSDSGARAGPASGWKPKATRSSSCPLSFSEIVSRTMLPVAHILWSSAWLGIATAAVERARRLPARPGTHAGHARDRDPAHGALGAPSPDDGAGTRDGASLRPDLRRRRRHRRDAVRDRDEQPAALGVAARRRRGEPGDGDLRDGGLPAGLARTASDGCSATRTAPACSSATTGSLPAMPRC